MKKYICLLALAALLPACEKKETTVNNPPGESKTENTTNVIKESKPADSKTETNINVGSSPSGGTSTTTTTTSSPNP